MAQVLVDLGLAPVVVVGHGTGEYAAACLAGALEAGQALNLLGQRAKLVDALHVAPAALRAYAGQHQLAQLVLPADDASVIAEDGLNECLISGSAKAIGAIIRRLADERIEFQRVRTASINHSILVDAISEKLTEPPSCEVAGRSQTEWISTLTGRRNTGSDCDALTYWRDHWRQPVRFLDAMREMRRIRGRHPHPDWTRRAAVGMREVGAGRGLLVIAFRRMLQWLVEISPGATSTL